MIDPDDPKSFLDDLLWTEKELKELLRQEVGKITRAITFEPYVPESNIDPRKIAFTMIIACPGGNQPEVFQSIRAYLKGLHIAMIYDNQRSSDNSMVIGFEAPRFRPFDP